MSHLICSGFDKGHCLMLMCNIGNLCLIATAFGQAYKKKNTRVKCQNPDHWHSKRVGDIVRGALWSDLFTCIHGLGVWGEINKWTLTSDLTPVLKLVKRIRTQYIWKMRYINAFHYHERTRCHSHELLFLCRHLTLPSLSSLTVQAMWHFYQTLEPFPRMKSPML